MKKQFLAILLAVVMCLAMAAPALAADSDFTIKNGTLKKYKGKGGDVVIPSGITSIGDFAFDECIGLTSVTIPNSVTSIGMYAFKGCTGLTSVTIPNSVTSIGVHAFRDCTGLTSVTIPNSITSIEESTFSGCIGLTGVTIPNSITRIGEDAFGGCTGLTSVTIPNSVTSIGGVAFAACTGLTSISIPNSVTSIGGYAFSNCPSLSSLTIPESITSITNHMFLNCTGLTSLTIPVSVTSIHAFAFVGCTGLKDVYYGGTEAQWNAIQIGSDNVPLKSATIHYNSSGHSAQPTTPTAPSTNLPTVEKIPTTGTAVARTQTAKLDGKDVQFQYYAVKDANGNESNYVKVRDLANALNGTKAQFNVGWNGKISITSNTAYQVAGGEGTTPYSGNQSYTAVSDTPVSFNGSDVKLTSFQLKDSKGNGYTYYKLRDLGQLLNFNVKWDGSVVIETGKPFTGK